MSILPTRIAVLTFTLTAAVALGTPVASAQGPGSAQTAAWTQQKFRFAALGFQSRYTCYGLRTYIRQILVELGAREDDLNVHEVSCSRRHPASVAASFWMLEPVPGARANAVPAHWETVRIRFGGTAGVGGGLGPDLGGCELAHQAMQQILPYFTARNAAFDPDCNEHHFIGNEYVLRADVLKPDRASRNGTPGR